jgi:hypothetical protein
VAIPRHHQTAACDGAALNPMSLSRIAHVDPILRRTMGGTLPPKYWKYTVMSESGITKYYDI